MTILTHSLSILLCLALGQTLSAADARPKAARTKAARKPRVSGPAINENTATPVSRIKPAKDFKVELLYSVPAGEQGSWVNLGLDNKGRIIASDQYGGN